MTRDFWRDKKVFVTGNTGFKGSWLSLWLAHVGARVQGYSLKPPTKPSLFELAKVGEVVPTIEGDIRDLPRLSAEMAKFGPDIVLHLAAQTVVLSAYEDPIETFSTNVVGTASVFESVKRLPGKCTVVNITTDKVYENVHWVWGYRENDRLGGRDPYSASKAGAEMVAHAYRESFFGPQADGTHRIAMANARAGNVIGGGDWTPYQVIPDTVQAMIKGQQVVLRHPTATRPWQHVLDCLNGYLTLAEALHGNPHKFASNWNFGPPDEQAQPVARVVEMLAGHWGVQYPWRKHAEQHAHEDMALLLNWQKARAELGWYCRLPLAQALEWVASWYKRQHAGESARALCHEQIDRYMSVLADLAIGIEGARSIAHQTAGGSGVAPGIDHRHAMVRGQCDQLLAVEEEEPKPATPTVDFHRRF
jgi:CDP-glucose 4,6-dehydratase